MWRTLLVVILIGALVHAQMPSLEAGQTSPHAKSVQENTQSMGVGSYLQVKRADGKSLKGRIEAIAEEFFVLRSLQEETPLKVRYEEVFKLETIKKTSYKGRPNATLARQAIEGLGVNTHVMVKLAGETILRGHIQAIDERSFTLRLDANDQLIPIRYEQVLQVHENYHVQLLTTIFVAIGALVAVVVWLAMRKPGVEPFVSTIEPNILQAGQSVPVKLTGNNFTAGATIRFKGGDGPTPMASNVITVNQNTITATVTVSSGGSSRNRTWDLVVTNPDRRSGRLKDGFTVSP